MSDKPLFIPMNAKYFDAFENGTKDSEYRLRGKRWNMETCAIGRRVVISNGYGKRHRRTGVVVGCHYCTVPSTLPGWLECYGAGAGDATVIKIKLDPQP